MHHLCIDDIFSLLDWNDQMAASQIDFNCTARHIEVEQVLRLTPLNELEQHNNLSMKKIIAFQYGLQCK